MYYIFPLHPEEESTRYMADKIEKKKGEEGRKGKIGTKGWKKEKIEKKERNILVRK